MAFPPTRAVHDRVRAGNHNGATSAPADLRASWLIRTPIAHRGLHDAGAGRPENSLAAFAHACALGFPIELDVRRSRDGEVVVFHDRTLRRLTGAAGRVEERDAAALADLRLLRSDERVPLLRDVLDLVAGRVPLLVELKASTLAPALERAVVEALRGYRGEVAIQSFNRRSLRSLRRSDAEHVVGHLWRRTRLPGGAGVETTFVGCEVDAVDCSALRRLRDAGAVALAWTVRSPAEAHRALRFVDNYIFEGFLPEPRNGHRPSLR